MVEFDFLEKGLLVSRVLLLKRIMNNEHKVLRISLNLMFGRIGALEIDQNAHFKLINGHVRIFHYLPWLTYWWNTQKWFPTSSVATFSGDILFEQDRLLMPIFDGHHSKYRDLVRQQEDYESIHRDLMIGLGTCEFDLMELETLSLTVKAPLTFGKIGTGSKTAFVVANSTLDDHPHIDLAIDGDEVDPNFDFVKGRSGALLREKMVEVASKKFVIVVDDLKLVSVLGGSGLAMLVEMVQTLIKDSATAGKEIVAFEGVVERELFLDMTTVVIIAVIIAGKEGVSVKSK
ncbi:hypothetical protein BC332_23835 [Capsicum chinense]|nr:hypothetical protein BC332_23835 [Capsicum chinense]